MTPNTRTVNTTTNGNRCVHKEYGCDNLLFASNTLKTTTVNTKLYLIINNNIYNLWKSLYSYIKCNI